MTAAASSLAAQQRVYAIWANIYDPVYRALFKPTHRRAALLAAEAGSQILEVGFGTGLTLHYYPPTCSITGIDVSFHMLQRARQKLAPPDVSHVTGLCVMDALKLAFSDNEFDAVNFPFVLALVPDPEAALDEALRVLKPGGRIVIANRFGAEQGLQEKVEGLIAPLVARLGWSCNFKISRVSAWAKSRPGVQLSPRSLGGYFKVITLEKA
jgi:phosphatidylethanolamine/phosphatidyl-N-methylethanolamine N-methyltransferase